jgi:signal transduction histidine kinase
MFELCTNIIKHAKASCVSVDIQLANKSDKKSELQIGELQIVMMDDGIGIQQEGAKNSQNQVAPLSGAGTLSVKRRVAELNAKYQVLPSTSGGMHHVLNIPIASFY